MKKFWMLPCLLLTGCGMGCYDQAGGSSDTCLTSISLRPSIERQHQKGMEDVWTTKMEAEIIW